MRRADRLIRIVHYLRGRRRAVTARQIAEEFEICTRTVYRDIQDLMVSGVPINGEAGVGYIIDRRYYLPPVSFDAEELEAIGLGISMVCQWTDDRLAEKAISALTRIKAVLPPELQGELEQIATYSITNREPPPWRVSLSELREHVRLRCKIRIEYSDETAAVTLRTVRPLALIFCGPVWMMAGWCETRSDFRNFRLDRIRSMETIDVFFEDETDKNLSAYKLREAMC